jgi:hypothetical protein
MGGGLLEVGSDGLAVCFEQRQPLVLRVVSPIGQLRIPADLANRHARRPEPDQEPDSLQVLFRVASVPAAVARYRFEKPGSLPVAQRVRREPGLLGGFGNRQGGVHPIQGTT